MPITAAVLNCTLKRSGGDASSTDRLLDGLLAELRSLDVEIGQVVRVADHDVKPGVTSDEGDGDEWPKIRQQIIDAEILVLGSPIWMGQPSSIAKRVLERLDAFLGEKDDEGRLLSSGKVAVVATVGNEDGAHHVAAEIYQSLADVGFTIPANAQTYWVGEAMGSVDYKDLDAVPDKVQQTNRDVARNANHLAKLLQADPYPVGD